MKAVLAFGLLFAILGAMYGFAANVLALVIHPIENETIDWRYWLSGLSPERVRIAPRYLGRALAWLAVAFALIRFGIYIGVVRSGF